MTNALIDSADFTWPSLDAGFTWMEWDDFCRAAAKGRDAFDALGWTISYTPGRPQRFYRKRRTRSMKGK